MASKIVENKLYYMRKPSRWSKGIGTELPEAYKKFWKEWKLTTPTPVHYIPKPGFFERHEYSGVIMPIQNVPIPLKYPKEINDGIWGGEAVVQGFVKKSKWRRRVPYFWVPQLQKSVLYSEILNTYMRVTITNRTMQLIHENYGFDHYLLKTRACDLRSELALKLKRKILFALANQTLYPEDPKKKEEVLKKYEQYLEPYTREDLEWYGLNFAEACRKWLKETKPPKPEPLKKQFRAELIAKLMESKDLEPEPSKASWITKMNPFSKTPTTQ